MVCQSGLSQDCLEAYTKAWASPVLLVSISVCSGDDKDPNDDVEGGVGGSLGSLMHFNENLGKLRGGGG